jgi:hypothetical protein
MLNFSLNQAIDLSTAATFGFLSVSGFMAGSECSKTSCVCVKTTDGKCVCVPVSNKQCSPDTSCNTDDSCCVDGQTMKCVKTDCPISPCSRANFKLAVASGAVTGALYLFRGLRN